MKEIAIYSNWQLRLIRFFKCKLSFSLAFSLNLQFTSIATDSRWSGKEGTGGIFFARIWMKRVNSSKLIKWCIHPSIRTQKLKLKFKSILVFKINSTRDGQRGGRTRKEKKHEDSQHNPMNKSASAEFSIRVEQNTNSNLYRNQTNGFLLKVENT